jgi:ABC-type polysaccharide/polyol phosphate export permease
LFLRFGFWLTPIFWSPSNFPEKFKIILNFNLVYYIIQGYRDSMLYHIWFFEKKETLFFWMGTGLLLIIGIYVFKKLKPHFGDVV